MNRTTAYVPQSLALKKRDMKTFQCNNRDLTALLAPFRAADIFINEGEDGFLFIMRDFGQGKMKVGEEGLTEEIIFMARPSGRVNDEIWYTCVYSNVFDDIMSGNIKRAN